MLNFKLDPQSGHSDSYLDIKFVAKFEPAPISKIRILNETIKRELEILGVSTGYISDETTIVTKNIGHVEGYINLFNKDKMNKGLKNFLGIDVKCEVTRFSTEDNIISVEESIVTFYNHSKSLDSNIIPFDLVITNNTVDLVNRKPMLLNIVSDSEKKYEICVRSEDGHSVCTFEVITRPGNISVNIPAEVLWYDLELNKMIGTKKFDIYWVKFEGVSHLKFMNRKFIKIDNTRISFNSKDLPMQPTERVSPTGKPLPDYFVLSHKYFVHTHKNWSEYGGYIEGYTKQKLNRLTMFWHESQNMESVHQELQIFGNLDKKENTSHREIRAALWEQHRKKVQKTVRSYKGATKDVLSPYAPIYLKKTVEAMSADLDFVSDKPKTPGTSSKKSGGCGCSRKKNG